jgi:hypothetical protein
MTRNQKGSVVLGAGPLGTALARQLEAQGKPARLFSVMNNAAYDMPGTHPAAVDGTDPDQISDVCEGTSTFEKPHIVDHTKFETAFGAKPTPHQDAVRKTLGWYRQNPI